MPCFTVRKGLLAWPMSSWCGTPTICVALAKQMGSETIEFIESRLEGKFQLEINREKTRVVDLGEEGASPDFLG